jgi:type II secretory ATPase GspE/PulE/Tfp pilus assembly ATPase PilB-like protein
MPAIPPGLNERLARAFAARGVDAGSVPLGEGVLVSDVLMREGKADGRMVNEVLQEVTGVKALDPSLMSFDPEFTRQARILFSGQDALASRAFPIRLERGEAHVVMAVPGDEAARERLEHLFGARIAAYVCHGQGITGAITAHYSGPPGEQASADPAVQAERAAKAVGRILSGAPGARDAADDSDVAGLLRSVMDTLAGLGSSDAHFEPGERSFRVRCRVDSVMRVVFEYPPSLGAALTRRVKMLSGMDPSRSDLPQDGAIGFNLAKGRPMDIRVSALPSLHGEKIVMRFLDKGKRVLTVTDLGLPPRDLAVLDAAISAPNGLLLVTGPTGSGKTTTLYAILARLNTPEVNILTAEDPVEYRLEGITQTPCSADHGMGFADALRSFLRQDPDIIMVGEIRDGQTADMAVKAAMTGHLVLSTLHTNDACGAPARLLNMGVAPYLAASARLTVLAQRLVRLLCPACRQPVAPPPARLFQDAGVSLEGAVFYGPKGCPECGGTGYRGRAGVYEIFALSEEMERIILEGGRASELKRAAQAAGMTTLRQAALARLARGETSLAEALRVTVED